MYYLFYSPGSNKFIQLTFKRNRVATFTDWSHSISTDFHKRTPSSGDWSTKDEWLSEEEFTLISSSPTPITPENHPEYSI